MKRILTFFALAAMMMPVSCIKDDLAGPEMGNGSGKGMKFTAVMEVPGSKTAINEDGSVAWVAGDQIKFDYEIGEEDSDPVISKKLETIIDGAAVFYADVPEAFGMTQSEYKETLEEGAKNSRHMYVSYPASVETKYATSAYHVTIPAVQDGSFKNASISLAKWNPYDPKAALMFKNLCGLLQVKVEDPDVRSIVLTSSTEIAGVMNVGFTESKDEDPLAPKIKNVVAEKGEKTITVNVNGAGTYYIAVLPGKEVENLYVELFDAEGNGLGDRIAKSNIKVERAHILPLGALGTGSFVAKGGYFVKPEACGAKDGSSWDNAADYATFRKLFGTKTNNKVVYFAGGDYVVDDVANVSAAHNNLRIYGGYPADARGYSLFGRDITAYPTILMEDASGNRIWNFAAGTYVVDGITFTGAKVSNVGSAFSIKKTAVVECYNCTFTQNESTKYGGAVGFEALTSTGTRFVNCQFVSNSATSTALGGAISSNTAGSTLGTVSFENCVFDKNTSEAGVGAVCAEFVNYNFSNCIFRDNTDKKYVVDAIYLKSTNGVKVYCDACNFYYTDSQYLGVKDTNSSDGAILKNNSNGTLALNNCLVTGPWGYKSGQISTGLDGATTIIVNSTLLSQTGYPAVLANKGETHVLNSIVLNAATYKEVPGTGRGVATNGKSYLYNSVFTKVDEGGTDVDQTTSKTTYGVNLKVVSNRSETFPVGPTWYGSSDSAGTMWNNKNASTTEVDDCRGKYYYYAWDGVYPEGAEFTNATLTQVTDWVKAADANFATWLGDRLGKDIRGVQRDATSMWPGSYQE